MPSLLSRTRHTLHTFMQDEDEFKPGDKKRRNPSRTGKLSAKAKEKEASSAGRRGGGGRRSGGEKPDSMKKDDVGNKSTQRRKSSRESVRK